MASVLETRLRERLRESLGGTYSVSASAGYERIPEPRFTVQIGFGSDPERAAELKAAVFEEIARLRTEGPASEDVASALEAERRSLETSRESNGWWATNLSSALESDSDPSFLVSPERYEGIDIEVVRDDVARYLSEEQYVSVVLRPRSGA